MSDSTAQFAADVSRRIAAHASNVGLQASASAFLRDSIASSYSYNFAWLGRPIIQYPQDIVAVQELIWKFKPDLIIETGIAHGGSLIMSASMLALLDYCDALQAGTLLDPTKPARKVLGIDIDIRPHNKAHIEAHPMANRIEMIQGSSIDPTIIAQVHARATAAQRVLVCLDSNHSHEHVLAELEAYAPLTTVGSYCVVFDTVVENLTPELLKDRPWRPGNSPMSAVRQYLKNHLEFATDTNIDRKLLISVAPEGYLKRIC